MTESDIVVGGSRPDKKLFGRFVDDVTKCRELMRRNRVLASGSALLWAFEDGEPSWVPSDLDLFVQRRLLGKDGLTCWHEFLRSEGYFFVDSRRETVYAGGEVCLTQLLVLYIC